MLPQKSEAHRAEKREALSNAKAVSKTLPSSLLLKRITKSRPSLLKRALSDLGLIVIHGTNI